MGKPTTILSYCRGINSKDHPAELSGEGGEYLFKGVNVDVSDRGAVSRRGGYGVINEGYVNAHSLIPFLNRYGVYADQGALLCYDAENDVTATIKTGMSATLPVQFASVGELLIYSNGEARGIIQEIVGVVTCQPYFSFVLDPSQEDREIIELPITDLIDTFNGSMYGAIEGDHFLRCSEPYKMNHYDQVKGYLYLEAPIRWVKHVGGGVIVGTDKGITAYIGTGVHDFIEKTLSLSSSIACSEYMPMTIGLEGGETQDVLGVLTLNHNGVVFISDQFEMIDMTAKIALNWENVISGSFAKIDNNYIFSGVTK